MIQIAWVQGRGLPVEHSLVRANPGVTLGACYQRDWGRVGIATCLRGFGYIASQQIAVNGAWVVGLPRVGGELTIGGNYTLW